MDLEAKTGAGPVGLAQQKPPKSGRPFSWYSFKDEGKAEDTGADKRLAARWKEQKKAEKGEGL